jgi:hypothetical protein
VIIPHDGHPSSGTRRRPTGPKLTSVARTESTSWGTIDTGLKSSRVRTDDSSQAGAPLWPSEWQAAQFHHVHRLGVPPCMEWMRHARTHSTPPRSNGPRGSYSTWSGSGTARQVKKAGKLDRESGSRSWCPRTRTAPRSHAGRIETLCRRRHVGSAPVGPCTAMMTAEGSRLQEPIPCTTRPSRRRLVLSSVPSRHCTCRAVKVRWRFTMRSAA